MQLTARMTAVAPSSTLQITAQAKALQAQGVDVINLAGGEPDADTPAHVKAAAIAAIQEGFTKYTPTAGIPELRAAAARHLTATIGVPYAPEEVVVTTGAKQALYNALQVLCQSGDEVLIPSPYWVSYPEMVKLAGATPVYVRTEPAEGFRVTPEAVERAVTPRTRVLLLNSPANPTGSVLPRQTLEALAALVAAKPLFVISDEIYAALVYGEPHVSIAACVGMRERTLVVNGVSKAYAMTGWRIGYAAGPPGLVAAMITLQDHATSNPASISQRAALAALTGDPSSVEALRQEFQARRDLLLQELRTIPDLAVVPPRGAFYAFCDVSRCGRAPLPAAAFAERLLSQAHVAVIPGEGFGWPTHLRLSFCVGRPTLREGLHRLRAFVQTL